MNINKFLKTTIALGFLATSSFALNINDAVDIALKNNQDLQNQDISVSQSIDEKSIATSSFLPKLDVSYGYTNINKPFPTQLNDSGTLSTKVSYNLFNGFKDMATFDMSDLNSKASKYYYESLKFDTILNVKKAYVNYLNSVNNKDTFEVQYSLFKKQYEDSKAKYEQGLLAKNDLLQVQVNMSNSLQNFTAAKANVQIAKSELSNILGGYDLENEKIEALALKDLAKFDVNNFEEKNQTIQNRSELKVLDMSLQSYQANNKVLNSAFYPKVDGSLSHNNYYNDARFGKYDSGVDEQSIASVSLTWNLFNGNSDNTKKIINKKEILKLNNEIEKTKLALKLQLKTAKLNYEVASANYQTADLSLEQSKENYNIVKSRFDEGVSSSTDLIDANYLLTQAKQNYYKAYFDKYISVETLKRVLEVQ